MGLKYSFSTLHDFLLRFPKFITITVTPITDVYNKVFAGGGAVLLQKVGIEQIQDWVLEVFYSMFFLYPKDRAPEAILNLESIITQYTSQQSNVNFSICDYSYSNMTQEGYYSMFFLF